MKDGLSPQFNNLIEDVAKVGLTPYNLSRVHVTQADIGKVIPLDITECMPNETNTVSINIAILSRNPIVRRLQNGMTAYIHAFFMYKRDLWDGYENHLTKGRSGKIIKDYPKFYPAMHPTNVSDLTKDSNDLITYTPYSPADYMGLPIVAISNEGVTEEGVTIYKQRDGIRQFLPAERVNDDFLVNNNHIVADGVKYGANALPLAMYCKVKRFMYMNPNLVQDNKNWFPDNEKDFIIPYNAGDNTEGYINCLDGSCIPNFDEKMLDETSGYYVPNGDTEGKDCKVRLNCLYSRPFYDDYFTTANPFKDLIRGNAPEIDAGGEIDWNDVFGIQSEDYKPNGMLTIGPNDTLVQASAYKLWGVEDDHIFSTGGVDENSFRNALEKAKVKVKGLSLSSLRKAVVTEKLLQRSARTDGSYKSWIHTNFGYMPSIHEHEPIYLGGTYLPIQTDEIVGTSGEEFGENCCRATGSGNNFICKFHNEDSGYLMLCLSIMPDIYYDNQGLDRMWTRSTQEDEYIPILCNLEPDEIKNKELYISDDPTWNEKPFGYKPRFKEMQTRRNIVTGLGACGDKAIFDSCTFIKRHYNSKDEVALNERWLECTNENIDRTPFTVKGEMPFDIIAGISIDKLMPMPFESQPADMGIKY